ncbi:hypothetical protein E2C01_043429 [Portunus trituberculatus]|uniref:Uncharacterized protein n=1 Tax=Portunus trituberculatus TaxID=210409 RepID=A0A5B7FSY9_PORTR|nr:hypothetical protein [Portunus trituberculatus]
MAPLGEQGGKIAHSSSQGHISCFRESVALEVFGVLGAPKSALGIPVRGVETCRTSVSVAGSVSQASFRCTHSFALSCVKLCQPGGAESVSKERGGEGVRDERSKLATSLREPYHPTELLAFYSSLSSLLELFLPCVGITVSASCRPIPLHVTTPGGYCRSSFTPLAFSGVFICYLCK